MKSSKRTVISDLDQVTSSWLTGVLVKSGAMKSGFVNSIEFSLGSGNWSKNSILKIEYSENAEGDLPDSLFLKLVTTDQGDEFFTRSEVDYYASDYIEVPDAPLVKCFDAQYSEGLSCYHLLLEDISESHTVAAKKPISLDYGVALAEELAILHAHWWGENLLAGTDFQKPSSDEIKQFIQIAQPGAERVFVEHGQALKPHWGELIRSIFNQLPDRLVVRLKDINGFTLIHGDTGEFNIMVSKGKILPLYLIDRQPFNWSLTTWLGVYDLAYAMVLDWSIQERRKYEEAVLKAYLRKLVDLGVTGYRWDQLYSDYRLSLGMLVSVALEYFRGKNDGKWLHVWLQYVKRALTAVDDLDCSALWVK